MSYLNDVFKQTANDGYFDFTRCQKPNGAIYGTSGRCKSGTEIGAKEAPAAQKPAKLGGAKVGSDKRLQSLSVAQLKQLRDDPRLYDYQKKKLDAIIAKKGNEVAKPTTAASKNARPVDPKVAAKVNKAMAGKNQQAESVALKAKQEGIANDVMTDKKFKSDKARIAEMVRRGVSPDTDFVALVADAKMRRAVLEENKRTQVGRSVQQEMERQMLRGEVKLDAKKLASNPTYQGKTSESLSTLQNSYNTMKVLMKDPSFQTPANRARLINTRIAIWQTEKALRESVSAKQIDPKTYAKTVEQSPKYNKTPGSTKVIAKSNPEDTDKLRAQLNKLSKELDNKGISRVRALEISSEILQTNRQLSRATDGGKPSPPPLKDIYKEQGFNAKPELVGAAADLRSRKDLLTNPDGSNVVLYRGVTTEQFGNQFKGLGEGGEQHFAGRGIYGNGSYAAAGDFNNPKGSERSAQATAAAYSGERKNLATKVTAFGLRNDANVVTFKGDYNERTRQYDEWTDNVRDRADKATGYRFTDVGQAAAAVGIHAYQVPQRGEDFYVVLNRGAVVAAMDSQFADNTGLR